MMATSCCSLLPYVKQIGEVQELIDEGDITEAKITDLIRIAMQDVLGYVRRDVIGEHVRYIDQYRQNKIDGDNTTFYTRDSFYRYSSDFNDDCALDENDIEVYLFNSSAQTRTAATVTSFDSNGKFILSSAPDPSDVQKMEINYGSIPVAFDPINSKLRNAVSYQTVSLIYGRLDPQDYDKITFRGLGITRRKNAMRLPGSVDVWGDKAMKFITDIQSTQVVMRQDDLMREPVHKIKQTYEGAPQYYGSSYGQGYYGPADARSKRYL